MTKLFRHRNREQSARSRRIYAAHELAHTIADFIAAVSFLIGSILFFWKSLETQAIWLFVVGSAFFMVKPVIKLTRELRLAALGDTGDLAMRGEPREDLHGSDDN